MEFFTRFYLDREKDMIVDLYRKEDTMHYVLSTPNHSTGNLIANLAKLCDLLISIDDNGFKVIQGIVPCYYNDEGKLVYIFRLRDTKVANIFLDGRIEQKASIPAISKTLMSQTKDYHMDFAKTVVKTFILKENKFHTDLHTHMNANLNADLLIALGIKHQIRYPLYYIRKLNLKCSKEQEKYLVGERKKVAETFSDSALKGKYLDRKIDDNTYINFASFILENLKNASYNIPRIRSSLSVMKDGQAVFTNLEKVYLYRYVFTKGMPSEKKVPLNHIASIPDRDIVRYLHQMMKDEEHPVYHSNTLFEDKLLWIGRTYQKNGIQYVEISDTTLVKRNGAIALLEQAHRVLPAVYEETGVRIRFLAAFRRIPLTIVKDNMDENPYSENLKVLDAVRIDPYVVGSDIVGEEINDIRELKPLLEELTKIAAKDRNFVIRIHAGENDSLRDNVYNSVRCIEESLLPGQKMPHMRIGHGLYTANLKSKRGKAFMQYLRERNVTLEFQITSNVRLNNLSDLTNHPLKQYLKAGISCVQGTDGGALYGTDSIDEQLSLEKILNLNKEELQKMCKAEKEIIAFSERCFKEKELALNTTLKQKDYRELMEERLEEESDIGNCFVIKEKAYPTQEVLNQWIQPLPKNKKPIVIAGGSFNNDRHVTKCRTELCDCLDVLLEKTDPNSNYFVIGGSCKGYEKYLLEHNHERFEIYAFVPSTITENEILALKNANVKIRVAIEPSSMGVYKSIAYEIFKQRDSVLIALDGNASALNLIQEAKNGKYKCRIFVNAHVSALKKKARSLSGYVTLLYTESEVIEILKYTG